MMSMSDTNDTTKKLLIQDLEDGQFLDGDSGTGLSPPEGFDMEKFHRGRNFFRHNVFSCSVAMYVSLIFGMSIPDFLEALIFTSKSDTPAKAFKRYAWTFQHVALWHYGNVWEKDSKAQKSVLEVRQIHRLVSEQMKAKLEAREPRKFISQYDMGVVLSGFMGLAIMYPEDVGIRYSLADLEDYVYFWYGIGHLLGIQAKYNICAHGFLQALIFCKSIEKSIVKQHLKNPPPEYKYISEAVTTAFQVGIGPWSILTYPVIMALSHDSLPAESSKLSLGDTIRYFVWKIIILTVKNVSWFRNYLNRRLEETSHLIFTEI